MRLPDELLVRRILSRSTPMPTGCRHWMGGQRGGYGRLWDGERAEDAHRIAYRLFVGPIPDGHHVLHRCDNPQCVEPSHLFTGTPADNMADRDRRGRNGAHKTKGQKRLGVGLRGTNHPSSKLTEAKARKILELAKTPWHDLPKHLCKPGGSMNVSALARDLEVSDSLVRGVIDGRNWSWLN